MRAEPVALTNERCQADFPEAKACNKRDRPKAASNNVNIDRLILPVSDPGDSSIRCCCLSASPYT